MKNNFRVRLCSDLDYEKMVSDIVWNDSTVAILSQEKGENNMDIKIFPPEHSDSWDFLLDDFLNTIQLAKERLMTMKKVDE